MTKKILTVLFTCSLIIAAAGCDNDDDNNEGACNTQTRMIDLTNGDSANKATSEWVCGEQFAFQIYDDGTGNSSNIAKFHYRDTSCGDATLLLSGDQRIDMTGISLDQSGTLTFSQTSNIESLDGLSAECSLRENCRQLSEFTNGAAQSSATTKWTCQEPGTSGATFDFVLFEDGAGCSSGLELFSYAGTGCGRTLTADSGDGELFIFNIGGDVSDTATTKTFTFSESSTDFPLFNGNVSCEQTASTQTEINTICGS